MNLGGFVWVIDNYVHDINWLVGVGGWLVVGCKQIAYTSKAPQRMAERLVVLVYGYFVYLAVIVLNGQGDAIYVHEAVLVPAVNPFHP